MSLHDERPWLALYRDGTAADVKPEFRDALSMFAATVQAARQATELVDELPKTVTGKILRRELRDTPTGPA